MANSPNSSGLSHRILLKSATAAAGTVVMPNVGWAQQTPRSGGTLRLGMPYNPGTVDPMTGRNAPDFNVLYAIFDPLIDFEPKTLELRPGLAKDWRFTDSKTLTLELMDGVQFHDGSPFNAEAVKFNLDRCKNDPRSNVKADLTTLDSVVVDGPNQVTLKLNRPNAGLPTMLTNRIGCMVSPKSVKENNGNVDRNPVGTGPFKFVEWQDNSSFKLVRNPDYWRKGLPYLDGIDIRIINEVNTLVRAAVAGEVDVATDLFVQQKLIADRSPNLLTVTSPALTFWGAFLNYAKPPLNDVRVRQALNYAINRDEINKIVMNGLGLSWSKPFRCLKSSILVSAPTTSEFATSCRGSYLERDSMKCG